MTPVKLPMDPYELGIHEGAAMYNAAEDKIVPIVEVADTQIDPPVAEHADDAMHLAMGRSIADVNMERDLFGPEPLEENDFKLPSFLFAQRSCWEILRNLQSPAIADKTYFVYINSRPQFLHFTPHDILPGPHCFPMAGFMNICS